jgi:iron(III) transport system permease protein
VAVAAQVRPDGGRQRRRPQGWAVLGALVALVVAGPLVALPLSFLHGGEALDQIAASLLPEALKNSVILAAGVGVGTLVLGGAMAALVSFYDFPGRRWLDWALVLPLAVPAYVLVFVLLGQYDDSSALQEVLRAVFGDGFRLPEIRSTIGTIAVLTAVLYPYVYALGRAAFLEQSRDTIEAARTLGLSHGQAIRRVAFPLARPALGAGAILAIMESLADFGAVNLLNYRAMTDAIYRVWYGTFDRDAALQLASVLVTLALTLVVLERLLRGRARYHGALSRGEAVIPRRLTGARGLLAAAAPLLLLLVVFALPVIQLVAWSIGSIGEGATMSDLAASALTTLLLAIVAAVIAVITATVITYGRRTHPSKTGTVSAGLATLGYAVPGSVVAVAIYLPLAWIDRQLGALVITGTAIGLVIAYLVRFQALAMFAVDARMTRIDPSMDDAARSLGADSSRVLGDVHLPLLWPGITTAALLVFVEVVKELPATALLRPLGNDTLAVAVWEATKDSRFDTAALPALLIVVVGLIPVLTLMRVSRAGTPLDQR